MIFIKAILACHTHRLEDLAASIEAVAGPRAVSIEFEVSGRLCELLAACLNITVCTISCATRACIATSFHAHAAGNVSMWYKH